jgi:PmbA protein
MEEILDIAHRSAESAEVFRVTSIRTPVQFEANRLKQIQSKESVSVALRLVKNGKMGFAQASGNISPADLVSMALETSQFGYQVNFDFPSLRSYEEVDVFDPQVERIEMDSMISLGQGVIDAVCANTAGILCEGSISRGTATFEIASTGGGHASCKRTNFSISMDGMLVRDGDILYVGDIRSSCRPILDSSPVTGEIIRQLDLARSNAPIKSGAMPVIFTPFGVAGSLLAPLISAFNGKTVLDGASPLKDKKDMAIFDSRLLLSDDPTIPYQPGSTPFDDEGMPARHNTLIDHGKVVQFYYDLHTAALAGSASTGNGSRSGGMPSPSLHALVIGGGNVSRADMIKDMKEGIIIEQLMGAEQGNILNGDFSGNVLLGYKVDNGEITGRVKDTMVSGNVYQLLKEVLAIGSDSRWIAGFVNTPSIYCPSIAVSAK